MKNTIIILVVLVGLVFVFLYYMGFVGKVKVTEKAMGPFSLAYESYTGAYKNTGKVFDKVYKSLLAEGINTKRSIGIYYDEPGKVPTDKLRSDCGSIIEGKDLSKANTLKNKFKIMLVPQKKSIVAEFPIKNSMSYMLAPLRVYPVLTKYAQAKGYKVSMVYEYYDMPAKRIYFVMNIE